MNAAFQVAGVAAIIIGFAGTWLAAHRPAGWLVGLTSAALWIPPLAVGQQWVAVVNCCISIGICARNYATSHATRSAPSQTPHVKERV